MSLKFIPMSHAEFRALLDLRMCSDPFPEGVDQSRVDNLMEQACIQFGFTNWITAYHEHKG